MKEMAKEKQNNFALYFLFNESVAFNQEEIKERIQKTTENEVKITTVVGLDGVDKQLYVHINIDGEAFDLVSIEAPLPENIMKYTVGCAYGDAENIQQMSAHGFHIPVFYKGNNQDRQAVFNAYKKLAYGFLTQGLLGIVNPYSWNAIGSNLIKDMIEDEETQAFSETPAMMIWRSFIKIPYENGIWFVTKGNNLFGVQEHAYFGMAEEAQDVYDIFETVFSYVYEGEGSVTVGDIMQIGEEEYLRFSTVTSLPEALQSKLQGETIETLCIEKNNCC